MLGQLLDSSVSVIRKAMHKALKVGNIWNTQEGNGEKATQTGNKAVL